MMRQRIACEEDDEMVEVLFFINKNSMKRVHVLLDMGYDKILNLGAGFADSAASYESVVEPGSGKRSMIYLPLVAGMHRQRHSL